MHVSEISFHYSMFMFTTRFYQLAAGLGTAEHFFMFLGGPGGAFACFDLKGAIYFCCCLRRVYPISHLKSFGWVPTNNQFPAAGIFIILISRCSRQIVGTKAN